MLRTYSRSYRPRSFYWLFGVWMVFCLALGIYSFAMATQWSAEELAQDGYSNVVVGDWKPFAWPCQRMVAHQFTATLNGQPREGVVCTSPFYSYVVA